jgi:hypothetical protein
VKKALRAAGGQDAGISSDPFASPIDVDFDTALNRAILHLPPTPYPLHPVKAHAKPLLDHITAKPLFNPGDRAKLAGFVRRLLRRIDELEPRRPGRPKRETDKATALEQAKHYAVRLVRYMRAQWMRQKDRKRVPAAETDRMVRGAKHEAAREFKVPASRISEVAIRNALKSGRFTVR